MKKLKTTLFSALFIFSSLLSANGETLTFPIKGFQTVSYKAVPLEITWNEKWFGQNPATVYNHNIARIAAILSEVSYVDVPGYPDTNEVLGCYKSLGISDKYIELHYNVDYANTMWGNDQAAFSFASKQIDSSKGKRNLIFVVIRGTPLNANEWISNVNISDRTQHQQEYHEGFLRATKQVENALIAYLLKNKIDIEDCFLLITGHSRGAAIANLLSAQLYETGLFNTDNIYAYTFASPNVTVNDDVYDPKYNYIWNIVNAEDIVPSVPMNYKGWKFKKYGHIKTIINSWNTDPVKYEQYYLPTMNLIYNRFLERNFCPFGSGPFLPIEVSAIVTSLNSDVYAFYNGIKQLRTKSEAAFWKIFPQRPSDFCEQTEENNEPQSMAALQGTGIIASMATKFVHKEFGVDVDYILNSFIDMHAMESYLSWLLALDEKTVYSELGTNLVTIRGTGDYAVFDSKGNTVATVLDGKVSFEKIKAPLAASSFLQDHVSIGIPANQSFTIVFSKESLIPTPIHVKVQHYTSYGVFIDETPETTIYPSLGTVYKLDGSNAILSSQSILFTKAYGKQMNEYRTSGDLKIHSAFNILGELSTTSSGTFNGGIHIGSQKIYGSLLAGHNAAKIGRSFELSPGIGNQTILFSRILLDTEFFSNLFYAISDDLSKDDRRLNLVPAIRFSLSFKPKHRLQVFAGANMDLHIAGFNDAAFDDSYRLMVTGQVWTGSPVRIVPNFQIGIKF